MPKSTGFRFGVEVFSGIFVDYVREPSAYYFALLAAVAVFVGVIVSSFACGNHHDRSLGCHSHCYLSFPVYPVPFLGIQFSCWSPKEGTQGYCQATTGKLAITVVYIHGHALVTEGADRSSLGFTSLIGF